MESKTQFSSFRLAWKGMRLKMFMSAIALFFSILGFNVLFNFTTLDRLEKVSAALDYHIIGEGLRRDIEISLVSRQGMNGLNNLEDRLLATQQRLENFYSMNAGQNADKNQVSDMSVDLSLWFPDGQLLCSTKNERFQSGLPVSLENPKNIKKGKRACLDRSSISEEKGIQFLQLPIHNTQNKWIGTLIFSYENVKQKDSGIGGITAIRLFHIIILLAGMFLLIVCLNFIFIKAQSSRKIPKKQSTIAMFFIIGPLLMAFSGLNTHHAINTYLTTCQQKAEKTAMLVKEDLQSFLDKGMTIEAASKNKDVFYQRIDPYPVLEKLTIQKQNKDLLLTVTQKQEKKSSQFYQ
ncbi:MAG: hypothetical protein GY729_11655, partial [Desulfobacteraceae bacterium]|nr:hypothetical protein [Desulfobacteraceae bacterium]